ncbi:uncharacterized protein K444DRAFT_722318 [Hyaloscypha bicolor E]|uniref:Uncharacterized protein n=1 Tax=Hyaloscypha bicolor E TaxID=1095630 RepID=A0A2J6TB30_9HELO|nr:uncharacterized protein K444DRAFT_722318 [Hyaloscypha bicolor E]PMD60240.1 hypothetical protein K444DRAFT_722318 [Hyaloscypha bicolor E]
MLQNVICSLRLPSISTMAVEDVLPYAEGVGCTAQITFSILFCIWSFSRPSRKHRSSSPIISSASFVFSFSLLVCWLKTADPKFFVVLISLAIGASAAFQITLKWSITKSYKYVPFNDLPLFKWIFNLPLLKWIFNLPLFKWIFNLLCKGTWRQFELAILIALCVSAMALSFGVFSHRVSTNLILKVQLVEYCVIYTWLTCEHVLDYFKVSLDPLRRRKVFFLANGIISTVAVIVTIILLCLGWKRWIESLLLHWIFLTLSTFCTLPGFGVTRAFKISEQSSKKDSSEPLARFSTRSSAPDALKVSQEELEGPSISKETNVAEEQGNES